MLKGDEAALVAGAVAGRSLAEIAAAAGISISTCQRRLRDPDILVEVAGGRAQQRREAVGQLNNDALLAIRTLRELATHEDPAVALRAAGTILATLHRFTRVLDPSDSDLEGSRQKPGSGSAL